MDFYKNKINTEFRVGVFTIIGILILALSYSWFTDVFTNKKHTNIEASFTNAGNIENGCDVTILGVKRGKVSGIRIEDNLVILSLKVALEEALLEGTRFIINEVDMMGDVQVEIIPGSGKQTLVLENIQNGEVKHGMTALMSEMGTVVKDLKMIIGSIGAEDGILNGAKAFIDTSLNFVEELKDSFNRNSQNIDQLITESAEVSKQLSELVERNEENITSGLDNLVLTMAEINRVLVDVKETSQSYRNLSEKALEDSSTVNRLLSEEDLYFDLRRSVIRVDSLLQDIQENPKKYFKFSVF